MARLYASENFPLPAVLRLRELGHDVLTMLEAGQAGRAVPDIEVLRAATAAGRAVVTLNRRHFVQLHMQDSSHAGLIVCSFDPDFDGQAQRIHDTIAEAQTLSGQLLRIARPRKQ